MIPEDSQTLRWGTLWGRHLAASRLPAALAVAVAGASIAPSLALLLGFRLPASAGSGLLLETVVDVLAVSTALLVAVFAWGRSRLAEHREPWLLVFVLPIAALLDAAALVPAAGRGDDTSPLLWTLSRSYLALALVVCGELASRLEPGRAMRRATAVAALVLGGLALAAGGLALGGRLGAPVPPWGYLVPRPWDLPALVLFFAAGLVVLPRLHRAHPSMLSYSLLLTGLPLVLGQLEMAFGSMRPGDGHALVAHWQRLVAYAVLLGGIFLDYVEAQHGRHDAEKGYESTRLRLRQRTEELVRADRERVAEEGKRRLAERSLRMLEKAVETMSLGVTITDMEGRLIYVNPAEARSHGYRPEELVGKHASLFAAPGEEARQPIRPPEELTECWTRERLDVTRDGRELSVRLVSDWVRDDGGRPIACVTLSEDITERRLLDRMKQDFISNVSHELRTPLTSILASLRLLDSGRLEADGERRRELLRIAYRNGERLLQLINDLLDLQKLSVGKMSLELEPMPVGPLLEEVCEGMRAVAESLEIEIEVFARADLCVLADRRRLIQVLNNLLSNALKFSPQGQRVTLAGRLRGERAVLEVRDRGPGIPEEFRDRLFEPFSQADGSAARASNGSGLGLSIVKSLTESMGGTVSFESRLGEGTSFFVELPLAAPEPGAK